MQYVRSATKKILALYEETKDVDTVSALLGYGSNTYVYTVLRKHGVKLVKKRKITTHSATYRTEEENIRLKHDKRLAKTNKPVWDTLLSGPSFMSRAIVNYEKAQSSCQV